MEKHSAQEFRPVSTGDGIVDNWSGSTMLPAFVSSLKSRPRKHTFVYAAFAEEEPGLFDSEGGPERREGDGQDRFGRNGINRGLAQPA
jgi:hypothetical protein